MKLALTIDADWTRGSQTGLMRLYDFFEQYRLPATVFFAGRFAEEYPDLVSEGARRGYTIGTHGWEHDRNPDEDFRIASRAQQELWLTLSTEAVERACGLRPTAFRAPNLSIGELTFDVLHKLRYTLDSSVPARRLLGFRQMTKSGYFGAPLRPYYPRTQNLRLGGGDTILEVPPSAFLLPLNMSALRVLGLRCLTLAAHRVARQSPVLVFYAHPVEFELPEKQEINSSEPARYRRGLGPQNIDLLTQFVDSILSRGYTPVPLSSFSDVDVKDGGFQRSD